MEVGGLAADINIYDTKTFFFLLPFRAVSINIYAKMI